MTKLAGVYTANKKDGTQYFRASITYKNKHISLGSFQTATEAHECYLLAKDLTQSKITISDYHSTAILSFEKWVCLINFRESNYYFKNPIFLYKNYFTYHLDPDEALYFDIEDLFYYSNHKIHKRQGYYFVNDYGMQISILNRYNIKNHAVRNRDYKFIDEDPQNFRYDNIEIINPYYGVIEEIHENTVLYKATININGTYIIGRYKTLATAAIAYNKTIDFLHNYKLSSKEFQANYIHDMSKDEYTAIYTRVKISKNILNLFDTEGL